jgi:hypothetical protein
MNIKNLQDSLPGFWTDETYPDGFNNNPLPHRHYNHALTHAMKALGGLSALSDALDHERLATSGYVDSEAHGFRDSAPKWLADLVICASRMAQQLDINLDDATQDRVYALNARWSNKTNDPE